MGAAHKYETHPMGPERYNLYNPLRLESKQLNPIGPVNKQTNPLGPANIVFNTL